MLMKNVLNTSAALLFLASQACAAVGPTNTILQNIAESPNLAKLKEITAKYPNIVTALSGTDPFTVFAPSDDAFAKAPKALDPANADLIGKVLLYHIIQGSVKSADLQAKQYPPTLLNDAAFVKLPASAPQVLVVAKTGNGVTISNGAASLGGAAKVITPDVISSNGVIHIIDQVLVPPVAPSVTAGAAKLNGLVTALKTANLVANIDGLVGATFFAPVDQAFQKANTGALSKTALADLLTYHAINSTVAYAGTLKTSAMTAANGASLAINVGTDGTITVNNAKILIPDVLTSNGVMHIIDTVLTTNTSNVTPNSTSGSTSGSTGSTSTNAVLSLPTGGPTGTISPISYTPITQTGTVTSTPSTTHKSSASTTTTGFRVSLAAIAFAFLLLV